MSIVNLFQAPLKGYFDYIYRDVVALRMHRQLACLEGLEASIILDCGCHAGRNTTKIAERLFPETVIGLEYGSEFIIKARERGIEVTQTDLNVPIPLQSASIDVITAFDVLEHLTETWLFVQELYRVVKPGGYVIIDSPNLASWHNIFALVLGVQPFSGPHLISMAESDVKLVRTMHRRDHNFSEHERVELTSSNKKMYRHLVVAAYSSLVKLLKRAGFVVERSWSFGYYPFPPLLARALCKVDPLHAHHYIIKARKPI
jgi:SAM-dependent methyltransferase